MNKLLIFDLDGVLLDSREIHYESLNRALEDACIQPISWDEHLSKYDGLPTSQKLKLLAADRLELNETRFESIAADKQKYTIELYKEKIKPRTDLVPIFGKLKDEGYMIAVASNSIRMTLKHALISLGLIEFVDYFVSNEDVKWNKPFPEMYWKCMTVLKAIPQNTIIFEDSHIGREGAMNSGATLIPIKDSRDLTGEKIMESVETFLHLEKTRVKWRNKQMNVLIPMAGAGSRFASAGYTFPKPLIEVRGKPMIQVVVENLNIDAHYIFLVQKEHYEKYNLKYMLNMIAPGCDIVQVDGLTEGAACTTLLAKKLINNEKPLLIANSDQYVEWNSNEVLYAFGAGSIDAGIVTFESTHPKWSYVSVGQDGLANEVAEKKVISKDATVGIYYWSHGADYVRYAQQMIDKNIRTNGEFYVAPVFNEAIDDGCKVRIKKIDKMWGIGTPEDLNYFLENHGK
jgi:HAD superfamily hydrolase (TIGR01509 family)